MIEINALIKDGCDTSQNNNDIGDDCDETKDLYNIAPDLKSGGVSVSSLLRGHMSKIEGM